MKSLQPGTVQPFSRTLFIVEGNPKALLVTMVAGRAPTTRARSFRTAGAALTWCRTNRAGLVYTPAADPAQN